jgi:hypothetical protein
MKRIRIVLGTAAIAGALGQTPKPAPNRKPDVREIRATGCVYRAQNGCVLLRTLDGKATYTVLAVPKPEAGTVVSIQGTAHQGSTPCKQGIALDVADWEPTGEKCVE